MNCWDTWSSFRFALQCALVLGYYWLVLLKYSVFWSVVSSCALQIWRIVEILQKFLLLCKKDSPICGESSSGCLGLKSICIGQLEIPYSFESKEFRKYYKYFKYKILFYFLNFKTRYCVSECCILIWTWVVQGKFFPLVNLSK